MENLVESYVADKLPVFDETVDISYGLYDELLNLLREEQINVQKAISTLLPQINSNVVLPNDIANLTQKMKKHIDAGRSKEQGPHHIQSYPGI